jgi:hypothetical protein
MDQIATEISNFNLKIDAIEQLLDKDYEEWTQKPSLRERMYTLLAVAVMIGSSGQLLSLSPSQSV